MKRLSREEIDALHPADAIDRAARLLRHTDGLGLWYQPNDKVAGLTISDAKGAHALAEWMEVAAEDHRRGAPDCEPVVILARELLWAVHTPGCSDRLWSAMGVEP